MLSESVTRSILLPELKFIKEAFHKKGHHFYCEKQSEFEVCLNVLQSARLFMITFL